MLRRTKWFLLAAIGTLSAAAPAQAIDRAGENVPASVQTMQAVAPRAAALDGEFLPDPGFVAEDAERADEELLPPELRPLIARDAPPAGAPRDPALMEEPAHRQDARPEPLWSAGVGPARVEPAPADRVLRVSMTDLGTLGGKESFALAINDSGAIVGYSTTISGKMHACMWENGFLRDLGTMGGEGSVATGINGQGMVVGHVMLADGGGRAILWRNGTVVDLGTLGGDWSAADGINERGQIVGRSTTADGTYHGFLWQDGRMTDLGSLRGGWSAAGRLNASGVAVGASEAQDGDGGAMQRAVRWSTRVPEPLGAGRGAGSCAAMDISDGGVVVGEALLGRVVRPVLWRGDTLVDLGSLLGDSGRGAAYAINEAGEIVGRSEAEGAWHAFLWRGNSMLDLGAFAGSSTARDINRRGQIAGASQIDPLDSTAIHAVLWTVEPPSPRDRLQALREEVAVLHVQGLISADRALVLFQRLDAAIETLDRGDDRQALRKIRSFVRNARLLRHEHPAFDLGLLISRAEAIEERLGTAGSR